MVESRTNNRRIDRINNFAKFIFSINPFVLLALSSIIFAITGVFSLVFGYILAWRICFFGVVINCGFIIYLVIKNRRR